MSKYLFITALAIGFPFLSFAQEYQYVPFPDSGAVWSEVYNPGSMEENGSTTTTNIYERFALSGEDTLINDTSYKKLYIFYDPVLNLKTASYIGGIREDQKRVYYIGDTIHWLKPFNAFNDYNKEKELLLYDFSVEIGDTIWGDSNTNVYGRLIVKDIDTIQIGNTLRKKYYFNYFWVEWIEGIGSRGGLLFAASDIPTGSSYPSNSLICFFKNDTLLYHNEYYNNCFPSTLSVDSKQIKSDITVFPNPANGNNIHFELGNNNIKKLEIFDLNGVLIRSFNTNGETFLEYPAGKLCSGIYLYRATDQNGIKQTGKFALQ